MKNIGKSKVELFHQALANPTQMIEEDLLRLMKEYPYSQPLRFAYERRRFLLNESARDTALALLYAHHPAWLSEYVRKPVVDHLILDDTQEEYISFEDVKADNVEVEDLHGDEIDREDDSLPEHNPVQEVEDESDQEAQIESKDVEEPLEILAEVPLLTEEESRVEMVMPELSDEEEPEEEEERVSIYNDHLMPYSFLWWLHKTRLEHADTYQPFAEPRLPKPEKGQFDLSKLDEKILDQQIREHVFRTQSPEEKLSEEVKEKVLIPTPPKKLDEVIEKFIREDPQIKPPQADQLNMENKARKSAEDQFTLVTETLAIIYADQGLYPKAIEVYKKLILRFPEKNAYFASRITELEQKLN